MKISIIKKHLSRSNSPGRTSGKKPGFFVRILRYSAQKRQKTRFLWFLCVSPVLVKYKQSRFKRKK
ncbi:MAG TPA: hypothetical protein DD001_15205 [Microcoleaceae bacterium UBA10368]|nr:hypothetical protein [Microcoleaceae cyanobacterium UBA10368]HCV28891.1 hypothetical protein [Microcoleaceae cyanobacterium UBA9251]